MTSLDPEHYRALVEHAPTMVWRAGPDGARDYVNATWLAFTGRTLDQERGDGWLDGVHPDDVDRCRARLGEHLAQRRGFELDLRLRRHDGVYRRVVDRGAPYHTGDGAFAGFVGSCVDVDERQDRAAAEAVELFEMSLDHLVVAGFDGYLKRVNPSWTRTLGWTAAELTSRPSIELVHPDDRPAVIAARQRLADGQPLIGLVNRYRCKDGSYRWLEWRSVAHVDRGVVYAAARDVTEQKLDQAALRDLTESLTATLNSIAEGVIAIDADGAIARMNPVAEKLTGWTSAEAVGRPLGQVLRVVVDTRDDRSTRLVGRDGAEVPIATSRAPITSADGRTSGAVMVLRDMSAEREARAAHEQLQRQLILADRMASVGTLAAGVAHEINNPLSYVMGNLDMLIDELRERGPEPASAPSTEWVAMAHEAKQGTERIRKIVRALKTFSRAEDERRTVIEVTPVLELSINMAFNEIRHRARLVRDYRPTPPVEADDARLGQVIINLLVNAAQAIAEGKTTVNEIRIATSTDEQGRAVIEVRDTGPGIPEGVLGRIFDPFFTTKPIGIGTGLGLSVCHNIVTSMGGEITARNQDGGGAIFRVVLPAAAGAVA